MVALSSQTDKPTLFFRSLRSEAHKVFRGAQAQTLKQERMKVMERWTTVLKHPSLASLIVSQTQ